MFKTLIAFIIIALVCVVIWSTIKVLTTSKLFKKVEYNGEDISSENIELLITTLKSKIVEYESKVEIGVENSKLSLEYFKSELAKAQKLQEKIKTI